MKFFKGSRGGSSGGDSIYTDDAERERAIRYSRTHEMLYVVDQVWTVLVTLVILGSGLSSRLRDRSERIAPRRLGPAAPYTIATTLLSFLTDFPLSYFSGYVVEHRYGLSNQTRRAWFVEQLKGLGISLVLGTAIMQAVYWVINRWPRRWWAVLSGLTVPFSIIVVNLAPVLLMPLFNKFQPLKDRAMAKRIKDLAAAQGVQVSEVLEMDMSKQTKKANAMFTGLGNTKRIVLGDTMLDEFTPDEVEIVLAHELGHQVHRDLWKLIALSAPTSVIALYSAHRLTPVLIKRFGSRWGLDSEAGVQDLAALPLVTLIGRGAGLAIAPMLAALSRNLIEHPADRYALDLTGNRKAFIGAMEKLGRMNLSNPRPSALVKYLLYDHPPIGERIEFARKYKSGK